MFQLSTINSSTSVVLNPNLLNPSCGHQNFFHSVEPLDSTHFRFVGHRHHIVLWFLSPFNLSSFLNVNCYCALPAGSIRSKRSLQPALPKRTSLVRTRLHAIGVSNGTLVKIRCWIHWLHALLVWYGFLAVRRLYNLGGYLPLESIALSASHFNLPKFLIANYCFLWPAGSQPLPTHQSPASEGDLHSTDEASKIFMPMELVYVVLQTHHFGIK